MAKLSRYIMLLCDRVQTEELSGSTGGYTGERAQGVHGHQETGRGDREPGKSHSEESRTRSVTGRGDREPGQSYLQDIENRY